MVEEFLDRPPFQRLDLSVDMPVVPPLLIVGRSEIASITIAFLHLTAILMFRAGAHKTHASLASNYLKRPLFEFRGDFRGKPHSPAPQLLRLDR